MFFFDFGLHKEVKGGKYEKYVAVPIPEEHDGNIVSITNAYIAFRTKKMVGNLVFDMYVSKKDVLAADYHELGTIKDMDPKYVTWNHASGTLNWEVPGATGASDRETTPVLDNVVPVVFGRNRTYYFDDGGAFLLDYVNNRSKVTLIMEIDYTQSTKGEDYIRVRHYQQRHLKPMVLGFDYEVVPNLRKKNRAKEESLELILYD